MELSETKYEALKAALRAAPRRWVVTGVAGFIGSNLLESLLDLDQHVVGLDNLTTGHRRNLDEVIEIVGPDRASRFHFVEGDIRDLNACRGVCADADHILHQAALGSVPRSLEDPVTTNDVNIGGHLNMMVAARDARVKSFVYAASSSTYGDHRALPKVEERIGAPLSPYAVTKLANEIYADMFARAYGFKATGLRYFNIFGARQDPSGAYAAVIPKWAGALLRGEPVHINGDGETSRDFCYIANAVEANILAALADGKDQGEVYNVAVGARTTLNDLLAAIVAELARHGQSATIDPVYRDFRKGDVRHSQADITKSRRVLGYAPAYDLASGLHEAMPWYIRLFGENSTARPGLASRAG